MSRPLIEEPPLLPGLTLVRDQARSNKIQAAVVRQLTEKGFHAMADDCQAHPVVEDAEGPIALVWVRLPVDDGDRDDGE